jgi:hypothetical protein
MRTSSLQVVEEVMSSITKPVACGLLCAVKTGRIKAAVDGVDLVLGAREF